MGNGRGKSVGDDFVFIDPGPLIDDDLELVLVDTRPGNPSSGYVPVYMFHMRPPGKKMYMGQLSLRIGSTEHIEMYAGHIGYTVDPPYRGRKYAARSCRLVFPLAAQHGINPIWITCNPDNIPSRRTCEIIGGTLAEIVPIPKNNPLYAADTQWKCRYRVDLEKLIH
jgi:tagatose 1,6-diphosphate aldolase